MQINLKERVQALKMIGSLASFLKNPESLESVIGVANSLQNSSLSDQMMQYLLDQPKFKELVQEGWRPKKINMVEMQNLPLGSLGRCYSDQLLKQEINPDTLIDPRPVTDESDYITHRLKETHDIIHILTGFGVDGIDELGLQGFNLAQTRSPLAVMLIFGGMLSALQNGEPLAPMLSALARGFQLGLDAELVIAYKLEEGWHKPLEEWRKDLNIQM